MFCIFVFCLLLVCRLFFWRDLFFEVEKLTTTQTSYRRQKLGQSQFCHVEVFVVQVNTKNMHRSIKHYEPWWPPLHHGRYGAPLPAPMRRISISQLAMHQCYIVKTRISARLYVGEAASMPNWPQLGWLWLTVPSPVRGHQDCPPITPDIYQSPPSAFHDEGPSLPATRGNLTIVVGVDKQKKLIHTEE